MKINKFMDRKIFNKKNKKNKWEKITIFLYSIFGFITLIFLFKIAFFEKIDVYQKREDIGFKLVENIDKKNIIDEDTPLKKKLQYSWTLDKISKGDNYLAFYVVHQYTKVYIGEELMYSLDIKEKNQIGKSPGSNWVVIPIYPEDLGKKVRVDVIPIYKNVKNTKIEFYIGSKFMIYLNQLQKNLLQIILSFINIILGIGFIITSMAYKYRGKDNLNLAYLGIFSFSIGTWKITDIRFAPIMFPQNTKALSYICIIMLLVGVVPWTLSVRKKFLKKFHPILAWISILSCIMSIIIVCLQITNILDLRETLSVTHGIIIILVVTIVGILIYETSKGKISEKIKKLYLCVLICAVCVILDIRYYYVNGNSVGAIYTPISFLIYIIVMGLMSIKEINYKANIDMHTGLFNKSRCNEIIIENEVIEDELGIIIFDINKLKYVNDTFGHDKGDILISEFANIVKSNVFTWDFVGRYGGDEFIAIIKHADKKYIDNILINIDNDIEKYNSKEENISISYANGYALSIDYPNLSLRKLFEKADYNMYEDKKIKHNKN